VLCGVVKASRDLRHEREAREATERMLAEQKDRAAAARRALVRARQVAAVCIVLALGAVAAAVFAYWSSQRAKRAEDLAQQSRVQAETLLGYLTAGFARELENSGRLDVIASLAKREIDYFHGLPADLKGPETQRTAAQALVQFARAQRRLGDLDAAWGAASEAVTILESQRKGGDESEATTIALARALDVQALILAGRQDAKATPVSVRAADVIGTLSKLPDASAAVRETECEVLTTLGFLQTGVSDPKAVATLEKALKQAAGLGARDVKDTYVSGLYTDAGAWLVVALLTQGRSDEARSIAEEASDVADGILALNPGDRTALYALALMQQSLGDASTSALRPEEAVPPYLRAAAVQQTLVDFDPKNMVAQNNLASVQWSTAEAYWAMGQVDEALEMLDTARATLRISGAGGTWSRLAQFRFLSHIAWRTADAGDFGKSRGIIDELKSYIPALRKGEPAGSLAVPFAELMQLRAESRLALARGDANAARDISADMDARLQAMRPDNETDVQWKYASTYFANDVKSQAEIALKEFDAAERSARAALAAKERWIFEPNTDARVKADVSTNIALALVGQGKPAEARQVIEPVVKLHRDLASRNRGDENQKVEMAAALYAAALADPQRRASLLRESRALLDGLPGSVKALASTRVWSDRVRTAAAG
jgi:tetratricopeptide (TPR) repeat protein